MPRKREHQTKYRFHMERRIDTERERLDDLADRLEQFDAPKAAVAAVRKASDCLDRADTALR